MFGAFVGLLFGVGWPGHDLDDDHGDDDIVAVVRTWSDYNSFSFLLETYAQGRPCHDVGRDSKHDTAEQNRYM